MNNSKNTQSDVLKDTLNSQITTPYYIEGLYIEPSQSIIIENNETRHIQPKVMEVLTYLCSKAELVVSPDELIKSCWPNQYISDSPLHKCIAQIRKALNDDPKNPRFIKTVPKKGYVFIAKVKGLNAKSEHTTPQQSISHWTGDLPYAGLKAYTFAQSDIFFGREQVIEDINNWVTQINEAEASWLSLSAPVGAGKSSLVYAGLLPKIASHSYISKTQQEFCHVLDLASLSTKAATKASTKANTSQNPHIDLLELLLKKEKLSSKLTLKEYVNLITSLLSEKSTTQTSDTGMTHSKNNSNDNSEEKRARSQTKDKQVELFHSQILTDNGHSRFALFVDHLEMLFDAYSPLNQNQTKIHTKVHTKGDTKSHAEKQNECFFILLQLLVSSKKCFLVTAIREQFVPNLAQAAPEHKRAFQYKIPEFNHTELIDVIQKPAELAEVNFEYNDESRERLDSVIAQELQLKPVPITIVQLLLTQLYEQKSNQQLTYKAYKRMNGIAGCFVTIAEQHYQSLTEEEQTDFKQILFRILTLNANGQIATSEQPCPISHFTDKTVTAKSTTNKSPINKSITNKDKLSVINKFINAGIFQLARIKEHDSGNYKTCVYLAHDSLLTNWPRIRLWIKDNIAKLYIRHDLKIATQRWLYHEKSDQLLIPSNNKIKKIKSLLERNDFTINDDEKSIIALSIKKLTRVNRIKKAIAATFFVSFISLAWLSVTLIKKNEQVTTTRNNAENLISFIIYDLKDKLEPLGKLELLNIVATKTLHYFELAGTDNLSGKALHQWVEALHILGQVNISKNNYAYAESYLKQTETALKHALDKGEGENSNNEKLLELYMLTNYWLGYSAYLQVDYETAEPFLTQYLQNADKLFLLYPKVKWHLEKSYALNNLGSLAEKQHNLSAASDYFEQSAQIKLTILETQPNNSAIKAELADSRSWQANIKAKAGKLSQAIDYMKAALSQVENINLTEDSFKNIERLALLEHKKSLLYYDYGDLNNAEIYSKRTQKNIKKLINNDNDNYLFKEDLLWSYLLSVQILINQEKLDETLIYLDKSRVLISEFKSILIQTKEIMRANVYLLQYQARTMVLLNQNKSATIAINESIKLFKQHLSVNTETSFYARIMLTKLGILSTTQNMNSTIIEKELLEIKTLLEVKLQIVAPDFKDISIYLILLKSMQELQADNPWLKLYQASDYNIPDHSIISHTH